MAEARKAAVHEGHFSLVEAKIGRWEGFEANVVHHWRDSEQTDGCF